MGRVRDGFRLLAVVLTGVLFIVRAVEPERTLVLGGDAGSLFRVGWAFVLESIDQTSTRLITRATGDYGHLAVGLMLALVWRPIDFGMQRRQLINLRWRVEAAGR